MPSPIAKYLRLLSLIVYFTLAKARADDSTTVTGPGGSTYKNLVIAAAVITPGLAFSVVFIMASIYRRPFGDQFVLRTPALLLGISPPYEVTKLHATPPDTMGETNV